MAALLVVSALAAVPAVTMAQETATPDAQTANETNATVQPGAQLAGAVSVGEAELDGEVQSRTFGIRVAQANTADAKAKIVAHQLNDSEQRLEALEERKQELQEARDNGSMSEGEYRAKVARMHAETKNVERLASETNETARGLPVETLEANGVNATRIKMLSDRANELSGPEVAEIARGIAGQSASDQARADRAGDRGDVDVENRTENVSVESVTDIDNETTVPTDSTRNETEPRSDDEP